MVSPSDSHVHYTKTKTKPKIKRKNIPQIKIENRKKNDQIDTKAKYDLVQINGDNWQCFQITKMQFICQ